MASMDASRAMVILRKGKTANVIAASAVLTKIVRVNPPLYVHSQAYQIVWISEGDERSRKTYQEGSPSLEEGSPHSPVTNFLGIFTSLSLT